MNNKNLIPQQARPISRISIGQLPSELAELSEEVLRDGLEIETAVEPSEYCLSPPMQQFCSFDGDEAE